MRLLTVAVVAGLCPVLVGCADDSTGASPEMTAVDGVLRLETEDSGVLELEPMSQDEVRSARFAWLFSKVVFGFVNSDLDELDAFCRHVDGGPIGVAVAEQRLLPREQRLGSDLTQLSGAAENPQVLEGSMAGEEFVMEIYFANLDDGGGAQACISGIVIEPETLQELVGPRPSERDIALAD